MTSEKPHLTYISYDQGFYTVDGYGMFSVDPNGVVHWLAHSDGTPVLDSFYGNADGRIGDAFANYAKKIKKD